MVRTESTMIPLGTPAPEFSLPATDGRTYSLRDVAGDRGLLIVFFCNHCPYAKAVQGRLLALARDFMPRGLGFALINSNDAEEYPDDSFENMKQLAAELELPFPYLYDDTQEVAKAFRAACTPDPFLYDAQLKLYYRGRIDDGGKDASKATREDLRGAIESLLAGRHAPAEQMASLGCNIKWKGGIFPDYTQVL